jgi:hypothetical protein
VYQHESKLKKKFEKMKRKNGLEMEIKGYDKGTGEWIFILHHL